MLASNPGTSSPCTLPENQTTAGVRAAIWSSSAWLAPRGSPIRSRSARTCSSRAMFSGLDTRYSRMVRFSAVVPITSTFTRSLAASAMPSSTFSCQPYCVCQLPTSYPSSASGRGTCAR